jgi:hypothetical protein
MQLSEVSEPVLQSMITEKTKTMVLKELANDC